MKRLILTTILAMPLLHLVNAQNVGIGTTTPAAQLHVKYAAANLTSSTPVLILDNPSGGTQTSLQFRLDGVETGRIRSDLTNSLIYATTGNGDHLFRKSGDLDDLMIIKGATGNVGIGTSNPSALLHVDGGNALVTGTFGSGNPIEETGPGTRMFFNPLKAAFRAGYTTDDYWDDNNLGEYSVAMGYNAQASGQKSFAVGNNADANATNSTAIGNNASAFGAGSIALGNSATTQNDFAVALGSGTTAKTPNSVVAGSNIEAYSYAEVVLGSYNKVYTPNSTSTWDANDRILTVGNGSSFGSKSDAMVILKSGRVGIGTSTPTDELQVVGKTKTFNFQMTNGANNNYLLQSDASGNAIWVYPGSIIPAGTGLSYSGTTLNSVWTSSGTDIYKNNSGNVGIGTSSPTSLLHVSATSNTTIIAEATSGSAYLAARASTGNEAAIRFYTGTILRWQAGKSIGTESGSDAGSDFFINRYNDAGSFLSQPFYIKRSTGNIGIGGISNPTEKLDVNGNVNMTALYFGGSKIMSNTGSDNLFAGVLAGNANTSGYSNTFIGKQAGEVVTSGHENTVLGFSALNSAVSGNYNVAIGTAAGFSTTGSGNIFIGYGAGFLESGSNKLYIHNTSSTTPLIYGDFSTNELTVNGSLNAAGALGLKVKTAQVAGTNNPDATGGIWLYASGTGTITLPAAASSTDRIFIIMNNTGAGRTISSYRDLTNTAQTSVANNTSLWIVSDGTNWRQIK